MTPDSTVPLRPVAESVDDRTEELAAHDALTDAAPVPPAYHLPTQRQSPEPPTRGTPGRNGTGEPGARDGAAGATGWSATGEPGPRGANAPTAGGASSPTVGGPGPRGANAPAAGGAPAAPGWSAGGEAGTRGGAATGVLGAPGWSATGGSTATAVADHRDDSAAGGPGAAAASLADAAVPTEPPTGAYPGAHRAPRPKYFLLRIAAVVVLVFAAAIGVAVTVLGQDDPDTVQVADDLRPDTPVVNPTAGQQSTSPSPEQPDPAAQQQAIDDAQDRAERKAADAQAAAAQTAADAADARKARAEEAAENGTTGAPVPTAPVDCETYSGAKNTGCALLSEFGFPSSEMTCLEQLWTKESGWRVDAENPSSGAYGIPQSLPGSKMASVADDWRTNAATQIRWGLGYIKGRYQTPCGAWNFFQNNGHY